MISYKTRMPEAKITPVDGSVTSESLDINVLDTTEHTNFQNYLLMLRGWIIVLFINKNTLKVFVKYKINEISLPFIGRDRENM